MTSPPIRHGTVTIAGGRIVAVGPRPSGGEVEDLGDVAIMPGLVNAHAHLEFSDLAAPLGEPGIAIVPWIREVMAWRRQAGTASGGAVQRGLHESTRHGTTTLAEIAQPGWPAKAFHDHPCDATVFLELIAPTVERVAAALDRAHGHLTAAGGEAAWRAGLSPHAPYSVHPELLRQVVALSAARRVPLAFHLAESREEMELLRTGGGPLEAFLQSLGDWDPTAVVPGRSPLDYLQTLARAHRALVIHGNYLAESECDFLTAHRRQMAVVYCPRTHAWFRHEPYPLARLLAAGATVALGTDSRASSPDLSLLAEMRAAARQHPDVAPEAVLRLGTLGGAQALGRDDVGSLEPGKWADLAVVALPPHETADPHELLFDSDRQAAGTYFHGVLCAL